MNCVGHCDLSPLEKYFMILENFSPMGGKLKFCPTLFIIANGGPKNQLRTILGPLAQCISSVLKQLDQDFTAKSLRARLIECLKRDSGDSVIELGSRI